jgi:chromosome segregation ATPase
MFEPIMYLAIGFLLSTLLGLAVLPLVHNRAVRLTTRKLEAATPLSMAEIQADKDQLRAEFAMSARRLEMSVEQLKAKTTTQLAELGKKSDAINRMKFELGEKNATIFQLEAREKAVKEQLQATEQEFAAKTQALREAETLLGDKQAELSRLGRELTDRSQLADTRQVELAAVNAQIMALQQRVNDAEHEFTEAQQKLTLQRDESSSATRDLNDARGRVENLAQRVHDLESQLSTQTREVEEFSARAADLENRLAVQAKILTERGLENNQLRQQLESLQALGVSAAAGQFAVPVVEKWRSEKAALEQKLAAAESERAAMQQELNAIKSQTESSWATERMENAVLRERINDIAAEVAKLAITLEGPDSPIEAILAVEARTPEQSFAQGRAAAPGAAAPNGMIPSAAVPSAANANRPVPPDEASNVVPVPPKGTLADRIRALQNQASRAQQAR